MSANMNQPHLAASPSCAICTAASTLVQTGSNPWETRIPQSMSRPAVQLGTIKEYTESASACPLCRTLLAHLHLLAQTEDKQKPFADDDVVEMVYIVFMGLWEIVVLPNENRATFRATGRGPLAQMRFIRHVDAPEPTVCEGEMSAFVPPEDHPGLGVDFSRIRNWIAYCDAHHRGKCFAIENPWRRTDPPSHLYFIDVEDERVSWQPGENKYLALSYVWGADPEPLVSTVENIGLLCQPGSLKESSELGKRLPKTIREAMTVTRELGTRYLWVDRLCIVQDDPVQKPSQLAAMAAIYGNASITLIVANGDDTCGLNLSVSPSQFSIINFDSGLKLLHDSPSPLLTLPPKPTPQSYLRRGWTLQEELLSPRTLKFTPTETNYLCRNSRLRHLLHDTLQLRDNRTATGIEIQLFKSIPDISTYGHLAAEYTSRFLTYDSDAAHAFSAIIAAYSRAMSGGMLFGLPEILFEGALLWQHPTSHPPLRRRREEAVVPSWSFLAWQGEGLGLNAWSDLYLNTMRSRPHSEAKDLYFHSRVQIVKCVEFWKMEVGSRRRERVASGYVGEEEARERSKDYGGIECKVPILKEPQVVSGGTAVWAKELVVRTWVCEVVVGGVLPSSSSHSGEDSSSSDGGDRGRDIAILSPDNETIGAVRPGANVPTPGTLISVILLSMGIASSPPVTWEMPELGLFHAQCPEPKMCSMTWWTCSDEVKERCVPYEFYNFMWVSWREDGSGKRVACREGLGRVERRAWDRMGKEEEEVLLG